MTTEDMLDDCEACFSDMTDWEVEFIESLREQLSAGRDLSLAQEQKLEEIWEERT